MNYETGWTIGDRFENQTAYGRVNAIMDNGTICASMASKLHEDSRWYTRFTVKQQAALIKIEENV